MFDIGVEGSQSEKNKQFQVYFVEEVNKYEKTLMIRESQIGALVYAIQNRKKEQFK